MDVKAFLFKQIQKLGNMGNRNGTTEEFPTQTVKDLEDTIIQLEDGSLCLDLAKLKNIKMVFEKSGSKNHLIIKPEEAKKFALWIGQFIEMFTNESAHKRGILMKPKEAMAFQCPDQWTEHSQKRRETQTLAVPILEEPLLEIVVADPQPSGATVKFLKSFSLWLEGRRIKLDQVSPKDLEEMQGKTPVLLVCNNHSRLAADIKNTTMDIKRELFRHMVLVILHVKKEKHLPNVSAKEQLTETNDFQDFQDIIDVAFDKDSEPEHGMYNCEMNKRALNTIGTIFRH